MGEVAAMISRSALLRLAVPVLLVAGCLAPGTLSVPVAAAATPCPADPVTLQALLDLSADEGPLAKAYDTDPMLMSERALACFGDRTLRFTAYVRDPGDVGWTYAYGLEPAWFRGAAFFVAASADLPPGTGPITALAVPPGLGDLQRAHVGHWVMVTGHFDDSAAQTCVASGEAGVAPNTAEAVLICRSTFVVESVARTSAPPTTTIAGVDIAAAPAPGSGWIALAALLGGALGLYRLRRRR
jgi:hypothetical protein